MIWYFKYDPSVTNLFMASENGWGFFIGFISFRCRGDSRSTVRTITIRDDTPYKEIFSVKRQFQHPLYEYPKFYYDIAIFELGMHTT